MEGRNLEDGVSDKKWKRMALLLLSLKEEEERLWGVMGIRKTELIQVTHELVSKDEQARKLTETLAKLNEEGGGEGSDHQLDWHPLHVFPEELWRLIFPYLGGWKDLQTCSRTCALFQEILKPLNAMIMFDEALPHLFRHLSGSELLKCRGVCQAWKAGVDNLLENHKSLRPHDDKDSDPRYPPFVTPMVEKGLGKLYTTSEGGREVPVETPAPFRHVQRQLFHIVPFQGISFLGGHRQQQRTRQPAVGRMQEARSLRNCPSPVVGRDAYVGHATLVKTRFLETFGTKINYLTVNFGSSGMELSQFVSNYLSRCLPNLRKLRMIGVIGSERFSQTVPVESLESEATPKLETIQMDELQEPTNNAVLDLLHHFHLGLRRLHITARDFKLVGFWDWANLVELHLKCFARDINEWEKAFRPQLPSLTKLGLIHQTRPCDNLSPSNRLIQLLNKISAGSRLNTLQLSGPLLNNLVRTMQQSSPSYAYAPSTLKTLEVEHSHDGRRLLIHPHLGKMEMTDMTSYTFLLNFPLLENLNLFWRKRQRRGDPITTSDVLLEAKSEDFRAPWYPHPYCKTEAEMAFDQRAEWEAVEVHKYIYHRGGMYRSNIWELLPKLKVLTFQKDVYTREEYEHLKKKRQERKKNEEPEPEMGNEGFGFA